VEIKEYPKVGDRIRVVDHHRHAPGRYGTIIDIHDRVGARYVVRFDKAEVGFYSLGADATQNKTELLHLRLAEADIEVVG